MMHHQTTSDAIVRQAIAALNARNSDVIRQADKHAHRALTAILVFVLGLLGGLLLVHWGAGCEGASLCMAAAITPTRTGWLQRVLRACRHARLKLQHRYLLARINAARIDLLDLEAAAEWIPQQQALHTLCIDAWLRQADDCRRAAARL